MKEIKILESLTGKKVKLKESEDWYDMGTDFSETDAVHFSFTNDEGEDIDFNVTIDELRKAANGEQSFVNDEDNITHQISKEIASDFIDSYNENWEE